MAYAKIRKWFLGNRWLNFNHKLMLHLSEERDTIIWFALLLKWLQANGDRVETHKYLLDYLLSLDQFNFRCRLSLFFNDKKLMLDRPSPSWLCLPFNSICSDLANSSDSDLQVWSDSILDMIHFVTILRCLVLSVCKWLVGTGAMKSFCCFIWQTLENLTFF